MRSFAELVAILEETSAPSKQNELLAAYFEREPPEDCAWALHLLIDGYWRRAVDPARMKSAGIRAAGLEPWLFDECLSVVGNLAETIALSLPRCELATHSVGSLAQFMSIRVLKLGSLGYEAQGEALTEAWASLRPFERLLFNKLAMGAFRPQVRQDSVVAALSLAFELPPSAISDRLARRFEPTADWFRSVVCADLSDVGAGRPYDLCCACDADGSTWSGAELSEWHAEWKWHGIRAQIVRREGQCFLWLKYHVPVTERFTEIVEDSMSLPDGLVIDGQIVSWVGGVLQPESALSKRLGKRRSKRRDKGGREGDGIEVGFVAFDVLEAGGLDLRARPLFERRQILSELLRAAYPGLGSEPEGCEGVVRLGACVCLPLAMTLVDIPEVERTASMARSLGFDGLVVKRLGSSYGENPDGQDWRVVRCEAMRLEAVLMYFERGQGTERASFAQLTAGVWKGDELVPIAKVAAALSEDGTAILEAFATENTVERFGPVRTLKPGIMVEVLFDGVEPAARRKAGVLLRGARIVSIREGTDPKTASTLESLITAAGRASP